MGTEQYIKYTCNHAKFNKKMSLGLKLKHDQCLLSFLQTYFIPLLSRYYLFYLFGHFFDFLTFAFQRFLF